MRKSENEEILREMEYHTQVTVLISNTGPRTQFLEWKSLPPYKLLLWLKFEDPYLSTIIQKYTYL